MDATKDKEFVTGLITMTKALGDLADEFLSGKLDEKTSEDELRVAISKAREYIWVSKVAYEASLMYINDKEEESP